MASLRDRLVLSTQVPATEPTWLSSILLRPNSLCRGDGGVSWCMVHIGKSNVVTGLGGLCLEAELTLKGWRPWRAAAGFSNGTSARACSSSIRAFAGLHILFRTPLCKAERFSTRSGVHAADEASVKQRPAS